MLYKALNLFKIFKCISLDALLQKGQKMQ